MRHLEKPQRTGQRLSRTLAILAVAALVNGVVSAPGAVARVRRADLVVTTLARPPWFKQPGQPLTLRTTVKNKGNKQAARSVTRYYLSENATKDASDIRLAGQRRVGMLKPGRTSTGAARLTVPNSTPPFLYHVIACADTKKQVREKNERNNCMASPGRMLVDGPQVPPNPLTITRTLGTGAVTASVDKDSGGSLTTTGADGTEFTLTIPADALIETTEITMTPIDSIQGSSHPFEFDGGLVGGVELEPHGLRLFRAAELEIVPAAPPSSGNLPLGFAYVAGGGQFRLHPWKFDGTTVTMDLMHFSGAGAGDASEFDFTELREFIPLYEHPEFRDLGPEHTLGVLLALLDLGEISGEEFAERATRIFIVHFQVHVGPALARAEAPNAPESDAFDAVSQCTSWARHGELLGLMDHENNEFRVKLRAFWEFCAQEFPKIAKNQFDQANERCLRTPPVNPPEQVQIMLRWARFSDLMLGGAHAVLGADYFDKVMECGNSGPATVTGTVSYLWTIDRCAAPQPGCGSSHREETGTLQIFFNLRNPNFCCDWDDAGGSYEAEYTQHDEWVSKSGGESCDNTYDAEASGSGPSAPEHALSFTFTPMGDDHDAFVNFSEYVEDAETNRTVRSNCDDPYDQTSVTAGTFWSNDCPFRVFGVPRSPGLMGAYDPDAKTIDMTCSDDFTTPDGDQHHIEVTGSLTVTGDLPAS